MATVFRKTIAYKPKGSMQKGYTQTYAIEISKAMQTHIIESAGGKSLLDILSQTIENAIVFANQMQYMFSKTRDNKL